jgi:hypothetical protein
MDDPGRFALVTFTSILFIVDPVAAIPTYLVITQQESPLERRRTARRACIAMRQSRQVCSATLSRSPSEVHPLRVTVLSRSASRRNARMPSS